MLKYEVPVVAKPLLPEDIKTKVIPSIQKIVEKLGGKLTVKDEWGKRHLAYQIKGIDEGYYIFFALELDATKVDQFNKAMMLTQDVLRFLVIKEENL